jgi:RNA polymerase sigma-70 factor (ECF subfamily)
MEHAKPPATLDDAAEWEVIARARVDRSAFAPLYARYAEPVYRYCRHRLDGHEAAEDAMARVFAKALSRLPAKRTGTVRSWLFAVAHNEVTDTLHWRRRHQPLQAAMEHADDRPGPEASALRAEADESVCSLLARLTDDQHRVVELRLSGLTTPEIADVLGLGLSAVKMTQFRAYARLRDLLEPESLDEVRHAGR